MADKDIISQLGLPDSLNKRLEKLLKLEKVNEKSGHGTFNKSFADLKNARAQFRKAYKKIRQHVPSKNKQQMDKKFFGIEDEDDEGSHGSSGSDFSDTSNPSEKDTEKIIGKLPSEFMTGEQRRKYKEQEETTKFLEAEFAKKKLDLDKAMEALGEEEEEDSKILEAMATELSKDGDYDFAAGKDTLDRIIAEIRNQSTAFRSSEPNLVTKLNKIKD